MTNKQSNITNKHISVASIEYQNNQGFGPSDIIQLELLNGENINPITKNHIIGSNINTDIESQLDMQMMAQTSENAEIWFWDEPLWLYSFAVKFINTKILLM